jgi:hypothetical protein
MIEANRYYNLNQGSDAILSQLKLGEEGGSVVTRDCGVGSCLGRSAPESVCVGFGAGDGNGLEPLAVSAACESIWGVAG